MASDAAATAWTITDQGAAPALGAVPDKDGVSFALCSERGEAVDLCLFSGSGTELARLRLPGRHGNVFHGYVAGCKAGQHYGFRVHGPYRPEAGERFNPHKLLLDPYARQLSNDVVIGNSVYGFADGSPDDAAAMSTSDSAAAVPKSIVVSRASPGPSLDARRSWEESVIYELNVRGFTMRHPALSEQERGSFRGLANGQILKHLKALGVTTLELMPVHAFIDETFLVERGLKNFWGYNSIGFFAPAPRYVSREARASGDGLDEFQAMIDAIHDHGFEVILDVVYNHTAEGNRYGPTISFRGIDNLGYYRVKPDNPGHYVNDTGCGNTINADSPIVRQMVLDSLDYWANDRGVDGFRFDLAPILGRTSDGFHADHPLLNDIRTAPGLADVRLIVEPWDVGPGGYQLGQFPEPFAEWNDKYRDSVRRFWCGGEGQSAEFARRLHGSADIFEHSGRGPEASINFVSSHDGFTLSDLVSYEFRHNHDNGEDNRDGHRHNFSSNHGIEGDTDDDGILAVRRRQRLNLLATLLISQGVPMLLAGDELGNSQHGNNNAFAQDNEVGWVDWAGLDADPEFIASVAALIELRHQTPLLRQPIYVHGDARNADGQLNINWLAPDGRSLVTEDWLELRSLSLVLVDTRPPNELTVDAVAIMMNADEADVEFTLPPATGKREWRCAFLTSSDAISSDAGCWTIAAKSLAIFLRSKVYRV
ncbi:MAG TPA: glycogen debranching protein GlgX [Woeseiaceae bacterium]|nr:glycogen debranching protein GlgX [Woeseiaceae bacterium]